MEKVNITYDDTVRVLRELAAERPDAFNPDASHFKDGQPCCIVGHVLHRLGATPEHLRHRREAYLIHSAASLGLAVGLNIDYGTIALLHDVQRLADGAPDNHGPHPWGKVVAEVLGR